MKRSLSSLTSREAVQSALDEFVRIGREAFLRNYGFKPARDYFVVDPRTGVEADSKAIVGAAFRYQPPFFEALKSKDFSGGDATVARLLQSLNFTVKHRSAEHASEDWDRFELEFVVADYLEMLARELIGQNYTKAAYRRRLLSHLPGRTDREIDSKCAHVSSVMLELGFPYLRSFRPEINFQRRLLSEVVSEQVSRYQKLDEVVLAAVQAPALMADIEDFSGVKTSPPDRVTVAQEEKAVYTARSPIKRDYLERESQNRSLGAAGEEFALQYERWRLLQLGLGQLADKVEHVSKTQGDGLGYDVLSYEVDGSPRFIEVKTTAFGERTPFFVSANEVQFAQSRPQEFRLYRLFDFKQQPRLFELPGPIESHCALDPTTYRASFG